MTGSIMASNHSNCSKQYASFTSLMAPSIVLPSSPDTKSRQNLHTSWMTDFNTCSIIFVQLLYFHQWYRLLFLEVYGITRKYNFLQISKLILSMPIFQVCSYQLFCPGKWKCCDRREYTCDTTLVWILGIICDIIRDCQYFPFTVKNIPLLNVLQCGSQAYTLIHFENKILTKIFHQNQTLNHDFREVSLFTLDSKLHSDHRTYFWEIGYERVEFHVFCIMYASRTYSW